MSMGTNIGSDRDAEYCADTVFEIINIHNITLKTMIVAIPTLITPLFPLIIINLSLGMCF